MKKLILCILFVIASMSHGSVISAERDVANHAFLGSAITKVVNATVKNDEATFWIMSTIFIGKELLDLDRTGFSINDLVYDYLGYGIIMYRLEF